jgi:Tol biopolymer transport system component
LYRALLQTRGSEEKSSATNSPFDEQLPRVSPDGRWLAYLSNESGRSEVYVVPFPGPGGRWQISNNGVMTDFTGLTWKRDGKKLYFHDAAGMLMAVDVQPQGSEFHSRIPRQLFSAPGGVRPLDTSPDGRILVMVHAEQGMAPPITLVMNWDAELKK